MAKELSPAEPEMETRKLARYEGVATTHLVAEENGPFVWTACGRSLVRTGSAFVWAEPVKSATCGTCRRIEEG